MAFLLHIAAVYLAASLLIAVPLGALMIIVGLFGGESIFGDYIATGASYLISGAAFCAGGNDCKTLYAGYDCDYLRFCTHGFYCRVMVGNGFAPFRLRIYLL